MGSGAFPEVTCLLCSKPEDLRIDLSADESGKAVHADCYAQRVMSAPRNQPTTVVAN